MCLITRVSTSVRTHHPSNHETLLCSHCRRHYSTLQHVCWHVLRWTRRGACLSTGACRRMRACPRVLLVCRRLMSHHDDARCSPVEVVGSRQHKIKKLFLVRSSFPVTGSHWDMGGCQRVVRGQDEALRSLRGDGNLVRVRVSGAGSWTWCWWDSKTPRGKQRTEKESMPMWETENEKEWEGVGGPDDQMGSETTGLGPGSRDRGVTSWQEGGLWYVVFSSFSAMCVGAHWHCTACLDKIVFIPSCSCQEWHGYSGTGLFVF